MTARDAPQRPPQLPDLRQLTEAQKDELILSLWETLLAVEGAGGRDRPRGGAAAPGAAALATREAPAAARNPDDLHERIRRTAPSRRGRQQPPARGTRLGGFGFLESKLLAAVLVLIGIGFLADFGVGWYQRRALAARDQAALALRNAAFAGLYVELVRVAHEPDGKSYRATLTMQNTDPAAPLYVMLNPLRVFVQTGLTWQEVPSRAPGGAGPGVVTLAGAKDYEVVFSADLPNWTQLIPGYMHVLIESDMLISRRSDPVDDIIERNNRFYVYLKPQGSDDAEIKRRSKFPGAPPVFIPMPPH
ncbi:hypothetical protein [Chelatococcus reniformis]|uniref:Uncharacterized protein n=1 Tax=Chelatococcus reniformis TaxID=1494448 RepID=A0A916XHS1_9HYPH|nr:hypothetical protein [Chelatococcus reniformis]GGC71392.1 hypothetical protein GCM10010994_32360 [Chelatococcus reniformis]